MNLNDLAIILPIIMIASYAIGTHFYAKHLERQNKELKRKLETYRDGIINKLLKD